MNTGGLSPERVRAWQSLEDLTRQMRTAQDHYFKTRTQSALQASKRLERMVDGVLTKLLMLSGPASVETAQEQLL